MEKYGLYVAAYSSWRYVLQRSYGGDRSWRHKRGEGGG